jgi:hypothetical protein
MLPQSFNWLHAHTYPVEWLLDFAAEAVVRPSVLYQGKMWRLREMS